MKSKLVSIKVENKDLDNLEDFITCIPLCNKHLILDEKNQEIMYLKCKNCAKIRKKWRGGSFRIWHKLVVAYDKKEKPLSKTEKEKLMIEGYKKRAKIDEKMAELWDNKADEI